MSKNGVIESINGFKVYEQAILLMTRCDLSDDEAEYLDEILHSCEMDWSAFLGTVFIHRVNGVVYSKIKRYNKIPKYVKHFLRIAADEQVKQTEAHEKEICYIADKLEDSDINYAFVKGAVLNSYLYEKGERISNDTDCVVALSDISKVEKLLIDEGYIQGEVVNGEITPATKKEKLFARLNTYEIVPFNKPIDNPSFPFHELDFNFRLSNEEDESGSNYLLNNTEMLMCGDKRIRTLTADNFLIFLCVHHYREAIMVYKIVSGNDLLLYKFMDVHRFVLKNKEKIDWRNIKNTLDKIGHIKDVYYTMYFTEKLYPGTISNEELEIIQPENLDFLEEYKGRDNSSEIYKWNLSFEDRFFSNERRIEAWAQIGYESNRFEKIKNMIRK